MEYSFSLMAPFEQLTETYVNDCHNGKHKYNFVLTHAELSLFQF